VSGLAAVEFVATDAQVVQDSVEQSRSDLLMIMPGNRHTSAGALVQPNLMARALLVELNAEVA